MLAFPVVRPPVRARHVTPVAPRRARGLVAEVYRQVEGDFGVLAPPVALHSPAPTILAASWALTRETLIADGPVDRLTREVVATVVSRANACPYCVDVHSTAMHGLVPARRARSLAADPVSAADPRSAAVIRRLTTDAPHAPIGTSVAPGQLAVLAGVATTFHYLNRMVTVFLGTSAMPRGVPTVGRRFLGRLMTRRGPRPPGASVGLLPPAPLPDDVMWAAGADHVAESFARAIAAVEAAAGWVSPEVQGLVDQELRGWDGRPRGLSRRWVEDAVAGLPEWEGPGARLALLTAMGGHQVDDDVVAAFRSWHPTDAALIELTSWASLRAARALGTRVTA